MKKVFYINDKLKSLLSNIIYEIQNYNSTIMKYTENIQNNIDNSNYIKDNKATILRQSFLIDKTMKLFYDFSDINSNNLILNKTSEDINKIIEGITKDFEDLLLSKRIKIKFNNNENEEVKYNYITLLDKSKIENSISKTGYSYNAVFKTSYISASRISRTDNGITGTS